MHAHIHPATPTQSWWNTRHMDVLSLLCMMAMGLQINMHSTVSTSTKHGENEIYILWFLTVCYLAEGTEEMKMCQTILQVLHMDLQTYLLIHIKENFSIKPQTNNRRWASTHGKYSAVHSNSKQKDTETLVTETLPKPVRVCKAHRWLSSCSVL